MILFTTYDVVTYTVQYIYMYITIYIYVVDVRFTFRIRKSYCKNVMVDAQLLYFSARLSLELICISG